MQTGHRAVSTRPEYKAGPIKGRCPPVLCSPQGWAPWLSCFFTPPRTSDTSPSGPGPPTPQTLPDCRCRRLALSPLPSEQPWASHLTSRSLHLLICRASVSPGIMRIDEIINVKVPVVESAVRVAR